MGYENTRIMRRKKTSGMALGKGQQVGNTCFTETSLKRKTLGYNTERSQTTSQTTRYARTVKHLKEFKTKNKTKQTAVLPQTDS